MNLCFKRKNPFEDIIKNKLNNLNLIDDIFRDFYKVKLVRLGKNQSYSIFKICSMKVGERWKSGVGSWGRSDPRSPLDTAKKQIREFEFSVYAAGRAQFPMCTHSLLMGGNARVGLEDNLFLEKGVPAKSNADQMKK